MKAVASIFLSSLFVLKCSGALLNRTNINKNAFGIEKSFKTFCNDSEHGQSNDSLSCGCDYHCAIYGDCCQDAYRYQNGDIFSKGHSLFSLTNKIRDTYECEFLSGQSKPVYIIKRCPGSWKASIQVKDYCENIANDSYSVPLESVPVIGRTTGFVYRNMYCSMCHNENNVTFFKVEYTCNFTTNFRFKPRFSRRPQKMNISEVAKQCTASYKRPTDRSDTDRSLLHCNNVTTCSLKDSIYRHWCEESTSDTLEAVVYGNTTYKNKYCAVCNGLNVDQFSSQPFPTKPSPLSSGSWIPSYRVLFDPNSLSFEWNIMGHSTTETFEKCPEGQVFVVPMATCQRVLCGDGETLWNNTCIRKPDHDVPQNYTAKNISPTILGCLKLNYSDFVLRQDGSVFINATEEIFSPGTYDVNGDSHIIVCSNFSQNYSKNEDVNIEKAIAFRFNDAQAILSLVGLVISTVCLGLHFFIYALLPSLRNLPGKVLMSLVASLCVAQFLFMLTPVWKKTESACVAFAVLMHYSYLAAFFWMNVMSFDICHTFSISITTFKQNRRSMKFIYYSLYAWGSSILITSTSLIIDHADVPTSYKPRYGAYGICWITQKYGLLIFFLAPVALLLLLNMVFFAMSVHGIRKVSKAAKFAKPKAAANRRRVILYTKLSIVMGLSWIVGYVAMASNFTELWYLFIFLNTWLGVFIFLVFVCNRKVYRTIIEKFTHNHRSLSTKSNTSTTTTRFSVSSRTFSERIKK
ncbi:uncharacterized protein LOC106178077 [Lingula anatina]|uniref:Uncharacterized protein LOC106178077 n=1 Tax=Lingula anatina TaxID=7574 RepID=A0A1S3K203_LINAN|nr:uncharacterized protein LOC106178077 [Lingula anatina]|eukprot:XP_013416552.1 uncharacterized protein LOC106178077 [Lingula anatina]